jgi:DNA-binding PadR family transcriptional regulator
VAERQTARRASGASPRRAQNKRHRAITGYLTDRSAKEFDRLVHERIRLGMMSALAVNRTLSFSDLKLLLRTTDGNISVHARKLEEAGYIACTKTFDGRIPKTEYQLTGKGRRALERYLNHMEALIQATRGGSE